jgi:hypothetical protein
MITSLEFLSIYRRAEGLSLNFPPPVFFDERLWSSEEIRKDGAPAFLNLPYPLFFIESKFEKGTQVWIALRNLYGKGWDKADLIDGFFWSSHDGFSDAACRFALKERNGRLFFGHDWVHRYDIKNNVTEKREAWDALVEWADILTWSLDNFLTLISSGARHMVKKVPQVSGKSVHWTESRSRIVLIDNREAAALQHKAGVKHTEEEKREINRAAHSRRGHSRLLSAPRYKANVGKRVFVKACWVGPKEWMDTAGQTLYKLMEAA